MQIDKGQRLINSRINLGVPISLQIEIPKIYLNIVRQVTFLGK